MAYLTAVNVPLTAGWAVRGYERGTGVVGRVTMRKGGKADWVVRIDVSKPMFLDPLPEALAARSAALAEQVADSLEAELSWSVAPGLAAAASESRATYGPGALSSHIRAAASIGEPLASPVPRAKKPRER